jgi:hypothetical protein
MGKYDDLTSVVNTSPESAGKYSDLIAQTAVAEKPQEQKPYNPVLPFVPQTLQEALFPTATKLPSETFGEKLKRIPSDISDLIGLADRIPAKALRGQPLSEPQASPLAPEISKLTSGIPSEPIGIGNVKASPRGFVEAALNMAASPSSYLGMGIGKTALKAVSPALAEQRAMQEGMKAVAKSVEPAKVPLKEGIGNTLQDIATRIQNRKIRIGKSEQDMGATREKLGQYNLFGSTKEVLEKTQSQIKDLAGQLKEKINSVEFAPDDPNTRVNIAQALNRAKAKAVEGTRTDRIAVNNAAQSAIDELTETYGLDFKKTPSIANNVDLSEAQLLKQEIGKKGDWLAKGGRLSANEDATNKAKFYNVFYDELKKELENKGPEGIKQINKQLSDLIPIDRAASKRLLVEDRNNVIGLEDYLGGLAVAASAVHGNLAPAAMVLANMASKSPLTAKGLYNIGAKLKAPAQAIPEQARLGLMGNATVPATTRAGLGGVAGYTMTDPNATPEEKARNAMIGAAGGAFVPMLAKMAGKKVAGIPGAGSIENINNIKNSLSKRGIRGDNLLNEMDKLEEIKQGLGEVDKNGYVTLYHRTTPEAAKQIVNSGKMTSKEDGLFFSTKPTGQAEGYGDAVVKVKIPMEKLEVNDIFHDETHLRLPTNSINKMIPIGKAELWNPEINQMGGQ